MSGRRRKAKSGKTRPAQGGASEAGSILGSNRGHPKSAAGVRREWAGHYRALLALRDRLLSERNEQLRAAAAPLEPHSSHMADSATDELDHDLALAELSVEQDALYEVEGAIRRILDGTYGICEMTGKRISASRLRAAPWTRFSREAQERLERNGNLRRGVALGAVHSIAESVAASFEEAESPDEERAEPEADDETLRVLNQLPARRPGNRKRRHGPNRAA